MVRVANLKEWAEKRGEDLEQVVRAAALQISSSIVKKTPVDTGRAKGNWIATVDTPASGITNNLQTEKLGVIGSDQQANMLDAISKISGKKYYFVNNLPYIRRLEYEGWSNQAPSGMVRVSVREFENALKKSIQEIVK